MHTNQVLALGRRSIRASFSALVHSLAVMMNVLTDCAHKYGLAQQQYEGQLPNN